MATVHPYSSKVFYQVFPMAYYDSNGDGIGDLRGLTLKLDYLKDLGIQGLWISPINKASSYHKYDVEDFYAIDPVYGNKEDFKFLLDEAHQRDMVVLMDLVINHTSEHHHWFQEAKKNPKSPYRAYYKWARPNSIERSMTANWYWPDGNKNAHEKYYAFFYKGMPDLNFDHPQLRAEVIQIGQYWLNFGVDGFRLDAALHIYPFYNTGNQKENMSKSIQWWQEFKAALEPSFPNALLLGEVWEKEDVVAPFLNNALHAVFNFDLASLILKTILAEMDIGRLAFSLERMRNLYQNYNEHFVDAIFLSNHDQERTLTVLKDIQKAKLAAAIILTLPGTPFIYYGEEIGMLGEKPDECIREPMVWDQANKDLKQSRWRPLEYNRAGQTTPVATQRLEDKSIWNHYRKLIHLRNEWDCLNQGDFLPYEIKGAINLLSYKRTSQDRKMLIVHNLSASKVATLVLPQPMKVVFYSQQEEPSLEEKFQIMPCSTIILEQLMIKVD